MARPRQQSGPAGLLVRTPGSPTGINRSARWSTLDGIRGPPDVALKRASMANSIAGYGGRRDHCSQHAGIPDQIECPLYCAKPLRLNERDRVLSSSTGDATAYAD